MVHGERQCHNSHYRSKDGRYLKVLDSSLKARGYGQGMTMGYLCQVVVQKETIRGHSQWPWSPGLCSSGSESSMVVAYLEFHNEIAVTMWSGL